MKKTTRKVTLQLRKTGVFPLLLEEDSIPADLKEKMMKDVLAVDKVRLLATEQRDDGFFHRFFINRMSTAAMRLSSSFGRSHLSSMCGTQMETRPPTSKALLAFSHCMARS
jgi:hypothetical protein